MGVACSTHVALMVGQHACYTAVAEPAWKVTTCHICITIAVVLGGCRLDSTGSGQGLLARFLNVIMSFRIPKRQQIA